MHQEQPKKTSVDSLDSLDLREGASSPSPSATPASTSTPPPEEATSAPSQGVGKVSLVGAGPGAIDYLTLQARDRLAQADVLVYDALVDEQMLNLVPAHCHLVHVGKRGGQPSTPQADINRCLVEYCQQGRQVVRLKSGDPFIFGRSSAEIQALQAAGCAVEVVPGLSSALAAPLLANIPLTDPVLSRSFAVATAHDPDSLNWSALAQIDTLVLLMATQHLEDILDRLQRHGRSPQTPIAILRWAGHPQQQIWTGTLQTIGQMTSRQVLSPAVVVVGDVVALRPFLTAELSDRSSPLQEPFQP